jgi:hypothetical protein
MTQRHRQIESYARMTWPSGARGCFLCAPGDLKLDQMPIWSVANLARIRKFLQELSVMASVGN